MYELKLTSAGEPRMWQSMTLDQLLTGTDTFGIRPVMRPVVATCSLLDEPEYMQRRQQRRRRSDSVSSRDGLAAATDGAACAALERLDLAIVLLRSDCRVLFANKAAHRIAARRDCYLVKTQKLQLVDQRSHRALESFLGQQPIGGAEPESPHCVSCRDDVVLRYFVFVEWLATPLARGGRNVSLSIYEPHLAARLSHELLARLYGLTRMESQLVAALFVQPVLQAAAKQGGISLNTAKTHLKHVFAKCGVRSKAELLRLLALGPRTL